MKEMLVVIPSVRMQKLSKCLKSIEETSSNCDIIVNTRVGSITNIINETFGCYPDYKYYHVTNDDFVYKTPNWDVALMNLAGSYGIAYGDDLNGQHKLPTASVISGDIVRALGWLQLPTLHHLCGDCVWDYIGKKLKILHYNKAVIMEHEHFLYKKADKDETYEVTNSRDMYSKDNAAFRRWLETEANDDCEKIRKQMEMS